MSTNAIPDPFRPSSSKEEEGESIRELGQMPVQNRRLETDRLQLQPIRYADWVHAKAIRQRPPDYVDYPVPNRDPEADRRWWKEGIEAGKCWMWGIFLKEGSFIGLLSAFGFKASGASEIGIELLHPRWMQQGYGREALEAWSAHLHQQGRTRQTAWVHPGNTPSLRLFAAAGFKDVGSVRDVQVPEWTFRVFRKGPKAWLREAL